jgi:bifunctional DNA primase/polymerase-like protein
VSRPHWRLRDAAVGYASRGIPVLPLHYPLPHHGGLQPVPDDQRPPVRTGCSCRDPGCGQPAKHPLGSLVSHGVKDATTNRARILAWWTRYPQANIGLATGLGNARPTELEHVDWRGRGGYVIAPPSRHTSGHPYQWVEGRNLGTSPGQVPAKFRGYCSTGCGPGSSSSQPDWPGSQLLATARVTAMRERRWSRSWPGSPPPRSASATASCGSRPATSTTWSPPAPSTTARSTKASWPRPSAVGCWPRSPARPAAPWPRAARSASPIPAAQPMPPAKNAPMTRRRRGRLANQPRRGGEVHGRCRPPSRLTLI